MPLDKESRSVAIGQYLAINSSLFSVAGVLGLPVYGLIELMHDLIEDDPAEDLETKAVRTLGVDFAYGWLPNLMNVDVAHRVTWRGLIIRDNDYRIHQIGYPLYLAEVVAGPAWSVITQPFRAFSEWNDNGNAKDAIISTLPAALKNASKAFDLISKGAVNKRGDIISTDTSDWVAFNKAIGFGDAASMKNKRLANIMKLAERKPAQAKSRILSEYSLAYMYGDKKRMAEIETVDVPEYNSYKYPRENPSGWGITSATLMDYVKAADEARRKSFAGVSINETVFETMINEIMSSDGKRFMKEKMEQYKQQK